MPAYHSKTFRTFRTSQSLVNQSGNIYSGGSVLYRYDESDGGYHGHATPSSESTNVRLAYRGRVTSTSSLPSSLSLWWPTTETGSWDGQLTGTVANQRKAHSVVPFAMSHDGTLIRGKAWSGRPSGFWRYFVKMEGTSKAQGEYWITDITDSGGYAQIDETWLSIVDLNNIYWFGPELVSGDQKIAWRKLNDLGGGEGFGAATAYTTGMSANTDIENITQIAETTSGMYLNIQYTDGTDDYDQLIFFKFSTETWHQIVAERTITGISGANYSRSLHHSSLYGPTVAGTIYFLFYDSAHLGGVDNYWVKCSASTATPESVTLTYYNATTLGIAPNIGSTFVDGRPLLATDGTGPPGIVFVLNGGGSADRTAVPDFSDFLRNARAYGLNSYADSIGSIGSGATVFDWSEDLDLATKESKWLTRDFAEGGFHGHYPYTVSFNPTDTRSQSRGTIVCLPYNRQFYMMNAGETAGVPWKLSTNYFQSFGSNLGWQGYREYFTADNQAAYNDRQVVGQCGAHNQYTRGVFRSLPYSEDAILQPKLPHSTAQYPHLGGDSNSNVIFYDQVDDRIYVLMKNAGPDLTGFCTRLYYMPWNATTEQYDPFVDTLIDYNHANITPPARFGPVMAPTNQNVWMHGIAAGGNNYWWFAPTPTGTQYTGLLGNVQDSDTYRYAAGLLPLDNGTCYFFCNEEFRQMGKDNGALYIYKLEDPTGAATVTDIGRNPLHVNAEVMTGISAHRLNATEYFLMYHFNETDGGFDNRTKVFLFDLNTDTITAEVAYDSQQQLRGWDEVTSDQLEFATGVYRTILSVPGSYPSEDHYGQGEGFFSFSPTGLGYYYGRPIADAGTSTWSNREVLYLGAEQGSHSYNSSPRGWQNAAVGQWFGFSFERSSEANFTQGILLFGDFDTEELEFSRLLQLVGATNNNSQQTSTDGGPYDITLDIPGYAAIDVADAYGMAIVSPSLWSGSVDRPTVALVHFRDPGTGTHYRMCIQKNMWVEPPPPPPPQGPVSLTLDSDNHPQENHTLVPTLVSPLPQVTDHDVLAWDNSTLHSNIGSNASYRWYEPQVDRGLIHWLLGVEGRPATGNPAPVTGPVMRMIGQGTHPSTPQVVEYFTEVEHGYVGSDFEQDFLALVNAERAINGTGPNGKLPLALLDELIWPDIATGHSAQQLEFDFLGHDNVVFHEGWRWLNSGSALDQTGERDDLFYPNLGLHENLLGDSADATAQEIFDAWAGSPGHYANMMYPFANEPTDSPSGFGADSDTRFILGIFKGLGDEIFGGGPPSPIDAWVYTNLFQNIATLAGGNLTDLKYNQRWDTFAPLFEAQDQRWNTSAFVRGIRQHQAVYALKVSAQHSADYGVRTAQQHVAPIHYTIQAQHVAPYTGLVQSVRQHVAPYDTTDPIAKQHEAVWDLSPLNNVRRQHKTIYTLLSGGQSITGAPVLTINGQVINLIEVLVTQSDSQVFWQAELELKDHSDISYFDLDNPFTINLIGETYNFIVTNVSRNRDGPGRPVVRVEGQSPAVVLDTPRADTITYEVTTPTSARTALETVLGESVTWDITDWTLPALSLSVEGASPISIAKQIVEASGATIFCDPNGTLRVRYKYPYGIPSLDEQTPDFTLDDAVDNISSVESLLRQSGENKFRVRNSGGAFSDVIEFVPAENLAEGGTLKVYPSPWRTIVVTHTDGSPVQLAPQGINMRQETEKVEFRSGEGSTQYPITSIDNVNWLSQSLGGLSHGADKNQITTPKTVNEGWGLAEVTYTVRSYNYFTQAPLGNCIQYLVLNNG